MKIAVIVGDHPRNIGLLKKLYENKKVEISSLILFKRENLIPKPNKNLSNNLKKLWNLHFRKRYIAEKKFFNFKNNFIKKIKNKITVLNEKELHSRKVIKNITSAKPQAAFIAGIPILRDPLLSFMPMNTVNLHLGIIPFYKGAITMFWPFYFLEPAMAGTTYHLIDKFVDTGEILHNNIPRLSKGDGMHDVACKAVLSAHSDVHLIEDNIINRVKKKIRPKKDLSLKHKGKLYLKSDWKPEMLKIIYDLFDDKIVDLYLQNKIQSKKPKLIKVNR